VPLVGMAHFAAHPVEGTTLGDAVDDVGGDLVWSPSGAPAQSRSDSASHGGFDDDSPTLTSVLLRVLDRKTAGRGTTYRTHTPLVGPEPPAAPEGATLDAAREHLETVDVEPVGTVPVSRSAPPRGSAPAAPVPRSEGESPEVQAAPRSSSTVMDVLMRQGWRPARH
jgi:hypothetical protein